MSAPLVATIILACMLSGMALGSYLTQKLWRTYMIVKPHFSPLFKLLT